MTRISLPALQLVSIHIPKTAGTSFRNILNDVYGKENVLRLDITEHGDLAPHVLVNEQPLSKARIPFDKIKVIHGHFQYSKALEYFEWDSSLPLISWLRDPAQRVISNYFYLHKIVQEKLRLNVKNVTELNDFFCSLEEFAGREVNRNRMHRFLEGKGAAEMTYLGKMERFDEDLQRLATRLNWPAVKAYEHNRNAERTAEMDEQLIQWILQCNEEDVSLYQSLE